MANNLFSEAKKYCKLHPRTSYQEAIKKLSGKKKSIGKTKAIAPKKVKITVSGTKNPIKKTVKSLEKAIGISGISMTKINAELAHQQVLSKIVDKHKTMLKDKALKAAEKAAIKREIAKYGNAILASKRHATALKKHI